MKTLIAPTLLGQGSNAKLQIDSFGRNQIQVDHQENREVSKLKDTRAQNSNHSFRNMSASHCWVILESDREVATAISFSLTGSEIGSGYSCFSIAVLEGLWGTFVVSSTEGHEPVRV
jgi:hypothetical protein